VSGQAWLRTRFSFEGRASRKEYWLQSLCAMLLTFGSVAAAVVLFILIEILGAYSHRHFTRFEALYWPAVPISVMFIGFILYAWALLAVAARRYHDLDRPFRFNPFNFFSSMRCLFSRGTSGPNRYGADPLQKGIIPE